ncbi:MAG: 6-bladed beta-propeller [Chitinophaga sp.]|uniref:6-bladed beta-propeller n=1 Tax=Chitinophaga sp. TaxID=1869181 RepID=UPI0025BB53F4|nr:6-bladed beta-propeller [Chitinophaga sp.]MBV8251834.1 6-bladed beta-propeller [Chitinophaga sp.]
MRHLFPLVGIVLFCCTALSLHAQERVLRIDPNTAHGGTSSKIFENVQYIPLETTKESLFGKIDKLEVTPNYFIIADQTTNAILIFDKKGKFHAKIAGPKIAQFVFQGQIGGMMVDHEQNTIIYYQLNEALRITCNFDGKELKREKLDYKFLSPYNVRLKNGAVLAHYFYSREKKDSIIHEFDVYKDTVRTNKFLPFQWNKMLISTDFFFSDGIIQQTRSNSGEYVYYNKVYSDIIYRISSDTAIAVFKMVYPMSLTLPQGFGTDTTLDNKRIEYLQNHKDAIYAAGYITDVKNILLFRLLSSNMREDANNTFAYHLQSNSLLCLEKVSSDSTTYFLPVATSSGWSRTAIHCVVDDYCYVSHPSNAMFNAHEVGKTVRRPVYPPALQQYFLKGKPTDNPVIVLFKLKEKF